LKNKRSALTGFGKDLEDELFELSEAVENRINLEARVRKGKREKSALQAELIEMKKERERIALKCDAVRRRHWEHEQDARHKWELSEAARRAELEMERDDSVEDEGMEFLLRSVTCEVSSLSDQGGLLERIRSFNGQLESMARILEGRDI
jgi:predicted RNase H-like nuclease (RuvC/YqgF family)